jgi:hypothetical protein
MPPILQVMKDIGGIEVPEYLARLVPETPAVTSEGNGKAPPAKVKDVAEE